MDTWYASPFTGLFTTIGPVPRRPHDPDLAVWGGALAPSARGAPAMPVSGAGWTDEVARLACVGEGIERFRPSSLPGDRIVETSVRAWPLDEPPIAPERWVLFHPEQYAQPHFPFAPFTQDTLCRWSCFREVRSGRAAWVPEELAYLAAGRGAGPAICPSFSTGLACGQVGDPVVLRGLQEVIERDGLIGAWWKRYPLEEWSAADVLARLDPTLRRRICRPNLRYRFYRVRSPFSAHLTIVTVEGEDTEGYCFSAGAAVRETRAESWLKAICEAVQGRYYVRYLRAEGEGGLPRSFAEHAVYYSLHPERLGATVLNAAAAPLGDGEEARSEGAEVLIERLGSEHPVLFRLATPPAIAAAAPGWYVVRVVVPGLQPLHADHAFPHLGGALWAPRSPREWSGIPPHPFA